MPPADPPHKKRGRKPIHDQPMTPAERQRASRQRRQYEQTGRSGKAISVMLSGDAHFALMDLKEVFSDLSQKDIIEAALILYAKAVTGH